MSKVVFLITCFLVLAFLPLIVQAKGQQSEEPTVKLKNKLGIALLGDYIDLLNASDTISSFNPISAPGAQLYNDMMLEYTIAAINADPNLLPNHWLYVKRFNTKGKVGSRVYLSLVMLDILQNPEHQDIVGFIDNTPSERISETFHQSEIVELCALNQLLCCSLGPLLDFGVYNTLFSPKPTFDSSFPSHLLLFLKTINIRRVGVVSDFSGSIRRVSDNVIYQLGQSNIEVASVSFLNGNAVNLSQQLDDINGILHLIQISNLRYVIILSSDALVVGTLLTVGISVTGTSNVWISNIVPKFSGSKSLPWNGLVLHPDIVTSSSIYSNITAYSLLESWPPVPAIRFQNNSLSTDRLIYQGIRGDMESVSYCGGTIAAGLDRILKSMEPSTFNGRELQTLFNLTYLRNLSYVGLQETPISYDYDGNVLVSYTWSLLNNGSLLMTTFGNNSISLGSLSIKWPDDGYNSKSQSVLLPLVSLLEVAACLQLLPALYVNYTFRKHPIIRHSSSYFNCFILTGAFVNYISILAFLPFSRETMPLTCMTRIWLPLIGFPMIGLAFIAKNARVWFIFSKNDKIEAWKLNSLIHTIPYAFFLMIEIAFITLWTIQILPILKVSQSYSSLPQTCMYGSSSSIVPIAIFNALALLSLLFLSYMTRNVPSTHCESTFLLFNIVFYAIVGGTFFSELETNHGKNVRELQEALLVWFGTSFTVSWYFGSKIIRIWVDQRAGLIALKHTRRLVARVSRASSNIRASVISGVSDHILAMPQSGQTGSLMRKSIVALQETIQESKGRLAISSGESQVFSGISSDTARPSQVISRDLGGTDSNGGGGWLTVDIGEDRSQRLSIASIGRDHMPSLGRNDSLVVTPDPYQRRASTNRISRVKMVAKTEEGAGEISTSSSDGSVESNLGTKKSNVTASVKNPTLPKHIQACEFDGEDRSKGSSNGSLEAKKMAAQPGRKNVLPREYEDGSGERSTISLDGGSDYPVSGKKSSLRNPSLLKYIKSQEYGEGSGEKSTTSLDGGIEFVVSGKKVAVVPLRNLTLQKSIQTREMDKSLDSSMGFTPPPVRRKKSISTSDFSPVVMNATTVNDEKYSELIESKRKDAEDTRTSNDAVRLVSVLKKSPSKFQKSCSALTDSINDSTSQELPKVEGNQEQTFRSRGISCVQQDMRFPLGDLEQAENQTGTHTPKRNARNILSRNLTESKGALVLLKDASEEQDSIPGVEKVKSAKQSRQASLASSIGKRSIFTFNSLRQRSLNNLANTRVLSLRGGLTFEETAPYSRFNGLLWFKWLEAKITLYWASSRSAWILFEEKDSFHGIPFTPQTIVKSLTVNRRFYLVISNTKNEFSLSRWYDLMASVYPIQIQFATLEDAEQATTKLKEAQKLHGGSS